MRLMQTDALFNGKAEHREDLRGIGSPGLRTRTAGRVSQPGRNMPQPMLA